MKFFVVSALLTIALSACDQSDGPPLEISEATVFAPLPGTRVSVAYMMIKNNTRGDIVIGSIDSPQFASARLHETQVIDGIARMNRRATLLVPARATTVLAEGGMHIMLTEPNGALQTGQPVTLQIEYGVDGLVIVNTNLLPRLGLGSND